MRERPRGDESLPNIYYDMLRTGEYAFENPDGSYLYTSERLEAVILEYANFLRRDNVMPRAEDSANTIIDRTLFELAFRDGIYDEPTEDEA